MDYLGFFLATGGVVVTVTVVSAINFVDIPGTVVGVTTVAVEDYGLGFLLQLVVVG